MSVRIVQGNDKMETVLTCSLLPVVTCAPKIPCASGCYACKFVRCYPTVRVAWTANTELAMASPAGFMKQVSDYLHGSRWGVRKKFKFGKRFRWLVSGDLVSMEWFEGVIDVARDHPEYQFLVYTKKYSEPGFIMPVYESLPENLNVYLSMWPGWDPGVELPSGYPIAWMQDGSEDRVPDGAFTCPGSCDKCNHCYKSRVVRRDPVRRHVVFPQH